MQNISMDVKILKITKILKLQYTDILKDLKWQKFKI